MRHRKNLNEVYEKLEKQEQVFKMQLKKACVCVGVPPFSIINSFCGISGIPFLYYVFSSINSLYNSDCIEREFINSVEYLEFEKKFSFLLNDLKSMLKNIKMDTPPSIFSSYYYLVRNGFLSINHTFKADNIPNYKFCNASSILAGYGVCRNLTFFLTELLRYFSYKSYNIEMLLEGQALCKMTDDSFLESEEEEIPINSTQSFNHEVTLLADGKKSYIMDVMNETFYLIYSNLVYPYENELEPIYTNLKEDVSFYKRKKIPKVDSSGICDFEKITMEYLKTKSMCEGYNLTFETFYLEHKELYKEICADGEELSKQYEKILSLYR